jgi:hypothetical protein
MTTRLVEFSYPDRTLGVIEVPVDMPDAEVEQLVAAILKDWKPGEGGQSSTPPEEVDEWALRPEARADFFDRRPRKPVVRRSQGWAATVGSRLARAGRKW